MNRFLRTLTPEQQVGLLFLVVFGLLTLASGALFLRSLRPDEGRALQARWGDLRGLLRTSWIMTVVFWIGWAGGTVMATLLFGLLSFFALREFISLSPTRRGDHRGLVLAFFVVLPVQFWLAATRRFDLFTVFIPVYVFLAIPVASALAGDPQRFLDRNAKLQWGIMVCVYGMSHVPALLLLHVGPERRRDAFLVFFLALTVQTGMVVQHLVRRRWPRPPRLPAISGGFEWRSWAAGVASGGMLGGLMAGLTPFKPGQALAMALLACVAGSLGHLVMKAIQRDRGVPIWDGEARPAVTGAHGLLARMDALCFAAPVFFHSVRWYHGG